MAPRLAFAGKKQLIDHGDGTWSINVRANFPPEDLSALQVTSDEAQDYCDFFKEGSRNLWKVTNGQHYFGSVKFSYGASESDVFLSHGAGLSHASSHSIRLVFHFPNPAGIESIGQTLAHEWGHYFYLLPDEYTKAGDLGWCADSHYTSPSETCTAFPTSSCSGGARCIRHNACVNPGADITQAGKYDGFVIGTGEPPQDVIESFGVVSSDQCAAEGGTGPHGVCILHDPTGVHSFLFGGPEFWPKWGTTCEEHEHCETEFMLDDGRCTATLSADWQRPVCEGESSCMMAVGANQQWCDADTHIHIDPETGASLSHHMGVLGTALSHYPADWQSAEDYNCWDQAKLEWGGLQFNGEYDPDIGLPPNDDDPDFCTWNVPDYTDVEDLADWSMILIDASGSMGADANGNPGWIYAVDGAEYFNQVAVAKQTSAGVYAWGDELWPVQSAAKLGGVWVPQQQMTLGDPVDLAAAEFAVYREELSTYIDEKHFTNLCAVLEGSKAAFEQANAPTGDREVVLITDAKFTRGDLDPKGPAGCRGVASWILNEPEIASQICAEAGMRVNVITTGASPRIELADWLAQSCGGWHFHAGDEQGAGGSLPHAVKVYEAVAKAVVANDVIALHERAPLEVSTDTEDRTFMVPPNTTELDVAWLGSPFVATALGTAHAFNHLSFELESPSKILYKPTGDSSELEALYRRLSVGSPEPGLWTMRLDKAQLPAGARSEVDVGWVASIDHPGYVAEAWVERPSWELGDVIPISGNVIRSGAAIGGMHVVARISAAGHSWEVPMFDDGHHGDGLANDGIYAALYAPQLDGPYAVKVDYELVPGISHTVPGDAILGSGPGPELLDDEATLVAHTSFEVGMAGVVTASLPALRAGASHENLIATVEGMFVPTHGTVVSLGEGVTVRDLDVACMNCELDPEAPVYELRFNADVAADAPLTRRDLLIEIGTADYRDHGAARIVGTDADPHVNPDADDVEFGEFVALVADGAQAMFCYFIQCGSL